MDDGPIYSFFINQFMPVFLMVSMTLVIILLSIIVINFIREI